LVGVTSLLLFAPPARDACYQPTKARFQQRWGWRRDPGKSVSHRTSGCYFPRFFVDFSPFVVLVLEVFAEDFTLRDWPDDFDFTPAPRELELLTVVLLWTDEPLLFLGFAFFSSRLRSSVMSVLPRTNEYLLDFTTVLLLDDGLRFWFLVDPFL
jgi:hypothetical protein